ncbi:hypothetical protein ACFOHH_03100, partial [Shinella pollutisoli]
MDFYAHSGRDRDKSDWQTLKEHLLAVARLAAEKARPFGLERAAFIAGLIHWKAGTSVTMFRPLVIV